MKIIDQETIVIGC